MLLLTQFATTAVVTMESESQTPDPAPAPLSTPSLTAARARRAGGRATEAGMAFQASVTAWLAAHLVAGMPVGNRFGLSPTARMRSLQCETGEDLDDIRIGLDDGGAIFIQCKTRPSLATDPDSDLGRAIAQVVALKAKLGPGSTNHTAVLAVALDAPRTLDDLEAACRLFDAGGQWAAVKTQQPDARRAALEVFENHARSAWPSTLAALTDADLVDLARLLRVRRFAQDATSAEWREAASLIGSRVYGDEAAGAGPMTTLVSIARDLIRTGAPADRAGLLRELRKAGHDDTRAPGYDVDIEAVRKYSREEQARLTRHGSLAIGSGITIPRDCLMPLASAVSSGSLLVIGEPGAGKTGLLLSLASHLASTGPLVFLSVDQLAGFRTQGDFRNEIGLQHDLIEVLDNWPGIDRGVLVIDALDASRGGSSEAVMATFIAKAVERLSDRWSTVASIRTFDLLNGQRFRRLMPGVPPDTAFADENLRDVRHFRVARLSDSELASANSSSAGLRELLQAAPTKLGQLLRNIFNLSLAVDLLKSGQRPEQIRTVTTQSELLRQYEQVRLPTQPLRLAAKATAGLMVRHRQLLVRRTDIEEAAVDDLLTAGVLVLANQRVAFSHHVLFDFAAGTYLLPWDKPQELAQCVAGDPALGLLLGPAMRFALDLVWHDAPRGRAPIWRLVADLNRCSPLDPVMLSIAIRTAVERVERPEDVEWLCDAVAAEHDTRAAGLNLSRIARFVGLIHGTPGVMPCAAAIAWARVAMAATARSDRHLTDAPRFLLMTMSTTADLTDSEVLAHFGGAARDLLRCAWSLPQTFQPLAAAAIRFVAQSYGSDPAASRQLLQRILDPSRLKSCAATEAHWLAEGVPSIAPHDPAFVAQVYSTLFGHDVTEETKTWVGGTASRILPLTSTSRQDYDHVLWQLNQALPAFLQAHAADGTRAVIGAIRGVVRRDGRPATIATVAIDGHRVAVADDSLSLQEWRGRTDPSGDRGDEVLSTFARFLQNCSAEEFRAALDVALIEESPASVWARLFGVATDRPDAPHDILWSLSTQPRFCAVLGSSRAVIAYLAARYPIQPHEDRRSFEDAALSEGQFSDQKAKDWWRALLARVLSLVPEDQLVTPAMRTLRTRLAASGELCGNPPFVTIRVGSGFEGDIVDQMLQSHGVDIEGDAHREIRTRCKEVEAQLEGAKGDKVATEKLAALWAAIMSTVDSIDRASPGDLHPELLQSAWGIVSNGVEGVAQSPAYDPDAPGLPSLDALIALLDRLCASPYPEPPPSTDSSRLGWSNWSVRVYAASSLIRLAPRFTSFRPDIVERLANCLADPDPNVRLQIAQSLHALSDVTPTRMWEMVEQVAANERNDGVLSSFLNRVLRWLGRSDAARCARLVDPILTRDWETRTGEGVDIGQLGEALSNFTATLYVAWNQQVAWDWLERWASDLRRGGALLSSMQHGLREVYFFGFGDTRTPAQLEIAGRSHRLLVLVASCAARALSEARPHLIGAPDAGALDQWRPLYIAADSLLDNVCAQIYHGSGAFDSSAGASGKPLRSTTDKQRFLVDFAPTLDILAEHASARTAHHLVETLDFLVDGSPSRVFQRLAALLLGSAKGDGYHFEGLAADRVVKLVRRYLADHRDVFADQARRGELVAVLDLFASAGWPHAYSLLFDLPEILR